VRGLVVSFGAHMAQDAADRLIAGRWMLHTALRRGPSGTIWRATDLATNRALSVEELRLPSLPGSGGPEPGGSGLDGRGPGRAGGGGVGSEDLWNRVAAEARTAALLDHPGLVRLDDVVVQDGVVYVATELVDALTLDELIARHGPIPVRRVAQLGLELLGALEAVHAAGLAHLDLRPANVLVAADGRTRLAGVGLATLRTDPGVERVTTAFLAPEQVRGDPAGPPADLWALGAILFLAVEGETPFAGDGSRATMAAILTDRPRPPELAAQLVPTLTALLTKPAGGRPTIAATRRLLEPLAGSPRPVPPPAGADESVGSAVGSVGSDGPVGSAGSQGWGDQGPGWGLMLSGVRYPPHPAMGFPPDPAVRFPPDPAVGFPPDPGARHPPDPGVGSLPDPVSGPPEGEPSGPGRWMPFGVHSPPLGPRAVRNAMDPVVQRVLLITGGSVLLALVSFAIAVAVIGDPLGLRSQAVASTVVTVPPTTLPPTTAPPTTVTSTTLAALVPPGWSVHTDPATGYQVAVPPGWQVVSDGGPRTELRDQSSPTILRIDWRQDPQADPVTLEQQASQAHAGERSGYSQARLEPAQFKGLPAALLEFTYQDGETWHALELGVRSPRHHVAMAIHARDRDWGAGWALFEAFKGSFVPPSA
jgi:eukaryotic-like serine/threonine-protein kinase